MRLRRAFVVGVALIPSGWGCGAASRTPDTQGVTLEPGPCGRGLLVVESDYQSSNVSALGFDGVVLSQSLDSSQTESGGFGVGLSGDVGLPSARQSGPEVVLIDRYPAGVLRFLNLQSARVTAELSVATGFRSNPHDYLALGDHKAYVARYESNPSPGQRDFDAGADVLVVDPSLPEIVGSIDLSPAMIGAPRGFSAHPTQLLEAGGRVFALLASYANDYSSALDARVVEIDPATDRVLSTVLLEGFRGCDTLALSPNGSELAASCTGDDLKSLVPKLDGSGVVLVDIAAAPRLRKRFEARTLGAELVGFGLDYITDGSLLYGTLGHIDQAGVVTRDGLWQLDTARGRVSELLRSESQPFSLGGVRCAVGCGACFATDAERASGSVLRFTISSSGALAGPTVVRAETRLGLPPRYLGGI